MQFNYEAHRHKLEELASWYAPRKGQRNEATTRLHLINQLFFDCLGWSKEDVVLEEPHGREYADYSFSAPRRVLIVEAKKEGDYFEIPAGASRLEFSIRVLSRDYPSLKAALEQASRYCQSRGVPFGAVTNGHQLLAFVATRSDGVPPLEGKALVFSSLEFMLEHFLDLWQALSKPGIKEKKLLLRLVGEILPELPPKLSATVSGYPGHKGRNVLQTDLQIVSELVIEDLTRSRDLEARFLEYCYCESGAVSQHSLTSKAILSTRYAALFNAQTPGPTPVKATTKEGVAPDLLAESLARRPILLIGDVGVGKTIFIRHLMKVDAVPIFDNAIGLYLDLGSQAALSIDLKHFVTDEIARQLREEYEVDIEERNFVRGVYHFELERFAKGIYADLRESSPDSYREREISFLEENVHQKDHHLRQSLHHLAKGRRKQIVIFLDNADQRDEATQEEAFLIAQEISEHWPAAVFVALRPETFHRSRKLGTLSGYHAKAFTISPPRIDRVAERRMGFALKLTSGDIQLHDLPTDVHIQFSKLDILIRILLRSFHRNTDLIEFIDNVCGGNIRLALDLIKAFIGSGHVNTQKILEIVNESGDYLIPLHEFQRAVIYGDAEHYDPDRSPITNLFDVSILDPKEHFLLPFAIGFLATSSRAGVEDGFVQTSRLYERLQGLGFIPEQIDAAIVRGCEKKLIEATARRIPQAGQEMPPTLRGTSVGLYHNSKLCRHFTYIDAMIVDTPILDPDFRDAIGDVRAIGPRLDRADIFRRYLDQQWANVKQGATWFDWGSVSTDLEADIQHIRNRTGISQQTRLI